MQSLYNRVAGQSVVARVHPLSDCAAGLLVQYFPVRVTLYLSWRYATRNRLLADDVPDEIHPAVVWRIAIAQSLYACGAALCFLNTYYAIAAIVLVQVNYAIAPRFCWGLFSRGSVKSDAAV